jgi:signal transduction histidine kinase
MDELVWTVNPQKDTLEGLASYLCAYAENYFRLSSVRCHWDIPLLLPPLSLSAERRHHLFMAFKETLGNIHKHARATQVTIQLALEDQKLRLTIQDNGAGFENNAQPVPATAIGQKRVGNGLPNLRWRMEQVGGSCHIQSHPGQGTTIQLTLDIASAEPET